LTNPHPDLTESDLKAIYELIEKLRRATDWQAMASETLGVEHLLNQALPDPGGQTLEDGDTTTALDVPLDDLRKTFAKHPLFTQRSTRDRVRVRVKVSQQADGNGWQPGYGRIVTNMAKLSIEVLGTLWYEMKPSGEYEEISIPWDVNSHEFMFEVVLPSSSESSDPLATGKRHDDPLWVLAHEFYHLLRRELGKTGYTYLGLTKEERMAFEKPADAFADMLIYGEIQAIDAIDS
jgi:hypothetical protein